MMSDGDKRVERKDVVPAAIGIGKQDFDAILVEYVNQNLDEPEIVVYKGFYESMKQKYNIAQTNELILLDMICFDVIRAKRAQKIIHDEGDFIDVTVAKKDGKTYSFRKVHEAHQLLNSIQSQIRQNMKEMLLTRKEQAKVAIGKSKLGFDDWLKDNVIDVSEEKPDGNTPKETKTS